MDVELVSVVFSGIIVKPINAGVIFGFIAVFILLFFSAMISGSEMAFFSLTSKQREEIKSRKGSKYKRIIKLLEKPQHLLATVLIANNFVNIAIVIISTYLTFNLLDLRSSPVIGFIIEVIVITALILLFGEILPKVYANQYPMAFSKAMSGPMQFLIKLFSPLTFIMVKSTVRIERKINKKKKNISFDELSEAIEITTSADTPQHERKILKGIVKFGDTEVKEIMKPRIDVVSVSIEKSFTDLLKLIRESGFSRIPVYRDTFDDVAGVLYIKDLLKYINLSKDFKWQELVKPPFFVPENMKINDLLTKFKEAKVHLAIVVDEYGGTSGIITLEDVIEEIVGEINDEYDVESDNLFFNKLGENSYIFEGKTSLNDFYKITGLPDDFFDDIRGEAESLAGLILEVTGKIPFRNELIHYKNIIFKIESADNRRIKLIKVSLNTTEKK